MGPWSAPENVNFVILSKSLRLALQNFNVYLKNLIQTITYSVLALCHII